jgi:hypothetical protein
MSTAGDLYAAAFAVPRDPRSPEYRAGVRYALAYRLGETPSRPCPYPAGTAQSDAYHSGCQEGHMIASAHGIGHPARVSA